METPQRIYINRNKPYVTYVLMGINIALFAVELILQALGTPHSQVLLIMGAKENTLITLGQYWRLLSACFLHSGIQHIIFNLFALYMWGPHIELLLGKAKYLIVYLTAGVYGTLLSYVFSSSMSIGASGAIFGMFGALLYFRTRNKQVFNQVFGIQVLVIIGMNLLNGFISTGIDNFGHIGGLIGGFCAAYCTGLYREKFTVKHALATAGVVMVATGLFVFGMWKYSNQLGVPMFTFLEVSIR